jgi:hypothetical protein
MTVRFRPVWALGLLLGAASPVLSQVRNVQVAPSPATVNQPATVTVGGTSPCGAVQIDYGDGTVTTYPLFAGLPFSQAHTWTTAGTKTVVATGQGNCSGQATTTVDVGRPNRAGRFGVNPNTGIVVPMRIKSYFGLSEPGGVAAIAGQGFGQTRGTVVALLKAWNGGNRSVPLTVTGWSPTLIEVEWPADLAGVRDQADAVVQARHANAIDRTEWKVFFRAEVDYQVLPMSRVRVVTCSDDGNYNHCNSTERDGDSCALSQGYHPGVPKCAGSFVGMHYNCSGAIGNDKGTDEFEVRLRNGWAIAGFDFQKSTEGGAVQTPAAPSGSASWNPRVAWAVTPADRISYCAFIHISGPKGVPF